MKRECVEICPHCEQEITKKWDVEKNGYQITCPNGEATTIVQYDLFE